MKKFKRWVAAHKLISILVLSALNITAGIVLLCLLTAPVWAMVLLSLVLLWINTTLVMGMTTMSMSAPLREYEKGNPYPLIEETEQLIKTNAANTVVYINHCAALREAGEYKKAYELLRSLDPKQGRGIAPSAMLIYYYNLCDLSALTSDHKGAEDAYGKMTAIYKALPDGKSKRSLDECVALAEAQRLFAHGKYNRTLDALDKITPSGLKAEITTAMLYARTYIKTSKTEEARQKLEFVVKNGNKLYAVTEAKQLLLTL